MRAVSDSSAFVLARDPLTSSDVLEELSEHSGDHIRRLVAANPSTPGHTLKYLLEDEDTMVIHTVLRHPSLPYEVFGRVLREGYRSDKCALVQNPNLPLKVLEALLIDAEGIVRETAADCVRLPVNRLLELAESDDIHTRLGVVTNMASTFSVLVKLLKDDFPSVSVPAGNRIWTVTDAEFERGLIEAGLAQFIGLPREWVMRVLGSGSGFQWV